MTDKVNNPTDSKVSQNEMRPSDYIIFVKLPDSKQVLLVHGYTGAIDLVKPNVARFLKHKGRSNGEAMVSESTIEILKQRGYLTARSPEEERARVKELATVVHRHQLKALKSFLFIPAYDCNFDCPYCYEAELSHGGSRWTKEVITKSQVDAAYKAIGQLEPNVDRCKSISLYGGEPLLARNYEPVSYIISQGIERGHTFGAITNGYELDRYQEFLGKGRIEFVQITVDGPPDAHDKTRRLSNGQGTFEVVQQNICLALAHGVRVAVRINTDKRNVGSIRFLTEIFRERGWTENKNFSAYASPTHMGGRIQVQEAPPSSQEYCRDASAYFRRGEFVSRMSAEQMEAESVRQVGLNDGGLMKIFRAALTKEGLMPIKPVFCGANMGMFIFDPRGDVYTCWEFVGEEFARVGRYTPELALEQRKLEQWQARTVDAIPRCSQCKYALLCGGGCQAFAYNRNGCYLSSYCDDFPKVFAKYVPLAYEESLKEKKVTSAEVVANPT
jgi:uncharacterized protein